MPPPPAQTIDAVVHTAVAAFASGLSGKHLGQIDNPDGIINRKIHNVFIEALGSETQYYTALVRSLDSSLGIMLESLATGLAKTSFNTSDTVTGPIREGQQQTIARLMDAYATKSDEPTHHHYDQLRQATTGTSTNRTLHIDYHLTDDAEERHFLIELKIGGDLDTKKARAEKEAILERYIVLANTLPPSASIEVYFATAYNRYGENNRWLQPSVRRYFTDDELLIGRDFWNFITQSDIGYETVLESYRTHAHLIREALASIRDAYLG